MTLEQRLIALAQFIAQDVKQLSLYQGDLTALSTTAKSNLVSALNEIYGLANSGATLINDTAGDGVTNKTWSANKIHDYILAESQALKDSILGGVGPAFDTLQELATALGSNPNLATELAAAIQKRVAVDQVQSFTNAEKLQGRQNIDAVGTLETGNLDADLVDAYSTAKAAYTGV